MLDRLLAVFLADAALLHAAEGQLVVDDLRRVDPGIAGFDVLGGEHGLIDVARPDRGAQAEDGIVCLLDAFFQILNSDDRKSRPEYFFFEHPRFRINVGHESRH